MNAHTRSRIGRLRTSLLVMALAHVADRAVVAALLEPNPSGRSRLTIAVTDTDSARELPCRVTMVDDRGLPALFSVAPASKLAVRKGVFYTPNGRATLEVAPGSYTVYASRGFEYSVDQKKINLAPGAQSDVPLQLRHEVLTPDLISCDTHVHTFTHSGHGDATVEERAVSLAGEGIALPIATDHDHLTNDLAAAARRMGVSSYFTPVVGDEVTTRVGHFNAFPLPADRPPPGHQSTDWVEILRGIRKSPGERVVVLNHPRDLHGNFRPLDPSHFNRVTGSHKRGPIGVDAIEVVNSGAMQSNPMVPVNDWMAILNHGERITAVGASDSHEIARHIVGQGRTYIAGRADDPAQVNVAAAVHNLRSGRALVSLGLLATIAVDDRFGPGDLATGSGSSLKVTVVVLGPSWTGVDRIELFANGEIVVLATFPTVMQPGKKYTFTKQIPRPRHDLHLVAVATGPGVTAPYWPIERPFQPTSTSYTPRVMAITNPVYIDGDNDGSWTSPLAYASALVRREGTAPDKLIHSLADYDEAVAAQAAGLCQAMGHEVLRTGEYRAALAGASESVKRGFASFATTLTEAR